MGTTGVACGPRYSFQVLVPIKDRDSGLSTAIANATLEFNPSIKKIIRQIAYVAAVLFGGAAGAAVALQ